MKIHASTALSLPFFKIGIADHFTSLLSILQRTNNNYERWKVLDQSALGGGYEASANISSNIFDIL